MRAIPFDLRRCLMYLALGLILGSALRLLTGCGGLLGVPHERGLTVEQQHAAAVLIARGCPSGEAKTVIVAHASGVASAPGKVLTAAHVATCAGGPAELLVTDALGVERPARVAWAEPRLDLAALTVAELPVTTAVYGAPRLRSRVCAEPTVPEARRACGEVVALAPLPVEGRTVDIVHTIPVVEGNSGAGVFDESGFLVGLITHRLHVNTPEISQPGGLAASLFGKVP